MNPVMVWAARLAPYAVIALLFGMLLSARGDLAAAIEQCNTDKAVEIADAEKKVRETLEAANAVRAAQDREALERQIQATAIAEQARRDAVAGSERHEETIRRLTLEASIDEIPDSKACLNVFVPESAVAGLRDREDCAKAVSRGSTWSEGVCRGPEDLDRANPAFSNITYSDALIRWGQDRDGLQVCNGRFEAIEALGGQPFEGFWDE